MSDPPVQVAHLVTLGPDEITLRSARRSWELLPVGVLAGVVPGAAVVAVVLGIGWLSGRVLGDPSIMDDAQGWRCCWRSHSLERARWAASWRPGRTGR